MEEKNKKQDEQVQKVKYEKPVIETEKLMGFGAVCNGNNVGGRKDTTGAPNFCRSNRLMS